MCKFPSFFSRLFSKRAKIHPEFYRNRIEEDYYNLRMILDEYSKFMEAKCAITGSNKPLRFTQADYGTQSHYIAAFQALCYRIDLNRTHNLPNAANYYRLVQEQHKPRFDAINTKFQEMIALK
jgi:hypothetical protein